MRNNRVRISFCGDIMLFAAETSARLQKFGQLDYADYLAGIKPLLCDSDYVVANLETPIAPSQPLTSKAAEFNSPPELLGTLKDIGFSFLSTANNHCLDRGVSGLKETLAQLAKFGFDHDGTFASEDDSNRVFVKKFNIKTCKTFRIAIITSTFGTNSQHSGIMLPSDEEWRVALTRKQLKKKNIGFNPDSCDPQQYEYIADDVSPAAIANPTHQKYLDKVLTKVRQAKTMADVVVAMPHVGGQYNPAPGMYAKYIVNAMRDAGADLVIGGHPHTSLRSGFSQGCFYTYSLGNLCFTPGSGYYIPNTLADYGIILHVYIDPHTSKLGKITFDVIKSVKCDDGLTRVFPVKELFDTENNLSRRERLEMENEAVVNRFKGSSGAVSIMREYEF